MLPPSKQRMYVNGPWAPQQPKYHHRFCNTPPQPPPWVGRRSISICLCMIERERQRIQSRFIRVNNTPFGENLTTKTRIHRLASPEQSPPSNHHQSLAYMYTNQRPRKGSDRRSERVVHVLFLNTKGHKRRPPTDRPTRKKSRRTHAPIRPPSFGQRTTKGTAKHPRETATDCPRSFRFRCSFGS